jgi:hypothetical protein
MPLIKDERQKRKVMLSAIMQLRRVDERRVGKQGVPHV